MSKLSVFEKFANKSRKAAVKELKNVTKVSSKEAESAMKGFKRKTIKLADDTKVKSILNKEVDNVPSKLVNGDKSFKVVNNKYAKLKDGSNVTGRVKGEGPSNLKNYVGKTPYEGRGQKYNFMVKDGNTATYHTDKNYHTDFVKNNTTAYKMPEKDAPKLGSFDKQKKYTMKDSDQLNNLRGGAAKPGKEESFLRAAVPTAVGGAMIFTMMNRRGQQSNSQLYGQQTPYQ